MKHERQVDKVILEELFKEQECGVLLNEYTLELMRDVAIVWVSSSIVENTSDSTKAMSKEKVRFGYRWNIVIVGRVKNDTKITCRVGWSRIEDIWRHEKSGIRAFRQLLGSVKMLLVTLAILPALQQFTANLLTYFNCLKTWIMFVFNSFMCCFFTAFILNCTKQSILYLVSVHY